MKKLLLLLIAASVGFAQTPPPYNLQISQQPLPIPANVNATYTGSKGQTTLWYTVIARYGVGNSAPAQSVQVNNINLAGGGSVSIVGVAPVVPTGYTLTYDVIRLTTSTFPASGSCTNCLVASAVSTMPRTDNLGSLSSYSLNTYNPVPNPLTLTLDNVDAKSVLLLGILNGIQILPIIPASSGTSGGILYNCPMGACIATNVTSNGLNLSLIGPYTTAPNVHILNTTMNGINPESSPFLDIVLNEGASGNQTKFGVYQDGHTYISDYLIIGAGKAPTGQGGCPSSIICVLSDISSGTIQSITNNSNDDFIYLSNSNGSGTYSAFIRQFSFTHDGRFVFGGGANGSLSWTNAPQFLGDSITAGQLDCMTGTTGTTDGCILSAHAITQTTATSCATGVITNSAGLFSGCVASDRRLKINIKQANMKALPIIAALKTYQYNWKDTKSRDTLRHYGFIAQEVQKVFPTAVEAGGGNGLLSVDPVAMSALMMKGEQELFERESAQQKEIEELRQELKELRATIGQKSR